MTPTGWFQAGVSSGVVAGGWCQEGGSRVVPGGWFPHGGFNMVVPAGWPQEGGSRRVVPGLDCNKFDWIGLTWWPRASVLCKGYRFCRIVCMHKGLEAIFCTILNDHPPFPPIRESGPITVSEASEINRVYSSPFRLAPLGVPWAI